MHRLNKILPWLPLLFVFTPAQGVTIAPANWGSLGNLPNPNSLSLNPTFYYISQYNGNPPSIGASFPMSQYLDIFFQSTNPNSNGILQVVLSTAQAYTVPAGSYAVVVVQGTNSSGATFNLPIANVGGIPCSDSTCVGRPLSAPYYYYGGIMNPGANQALQFGFYPGDFCINAGSVSSCNGSGQLIAPAGVTSANISLTFNLIQFTPDSGVGAATPIVSNLSQYTSLDTAATISFSFVAATGVFTCPASVTAFEGLYYPGSNSIFMGQTYSIFNSLFNVSGGGAPAANLIPVLSTGVPDVSLAYASNNALAAIISLYTGATVQKLVNGVQYNMSFLIQDATGMITPPSNPPSCVLTPVQSSRIEGYLDNVTGFGGCVGLTTRDTSSHSPRASRTSQAPRDTDAALLLLFISAGFFWIRGRMRRSFL